MNEHDCCFPPSETPEVIYGSWQADDSFQDVLGEVKMFLFFCFTCCLLTFCCVRSVFSSTASSIAPTCFWPPQATNVVEFWTQNQSVFFSFHPGHAWKESRKLACGILQGSDQLKTHSWRQKRGTPTGWRAIILTCKWSILMQERKQHILPAEHTNADSHIQSRVI